MLPTDNESPKFQAEVLAFEEVLVNITFELAVIPSSGETTKPAAGWGDITTILPITVVPVQLLESVQERATE